MLVDDKSKKKEKRKKENSNEIVQLFKCSIEDLPAPAIPAAFEAGTTMPGTSIPDEPPTFPVDKNPALIDGEDATSQPRNLATSTLHRQEDVVTLVAAAKRERQLARPPSSLSQGKKKVWYPIHPASTRTGASKLSSIQIPRNPCSSNRPV